MTSFRVAARHPTSIRAGVRVGDSVEREATLEDIGIEGAKLRMRSAPSVGSIVRLRIDTSTRWSALELDAIVRWLGESDHEGMARFGCELAPLTAESALALVEWLATMPATPAHRSRS